MPCTTLLVGKLASYDGSTLMARNEDCGPGHFDAKTVEVILPENQPRHYKAVLSKLELDLPENPLRYTHCRNACPDEGVWGAAGVNAANVAMTATETITPNPRVQGGDPLLKGEGLGEEDMVTLVLPYIHSAREGVERLGALLTRYGTYEMNGIGFQDVNEIWWLETLGGHHWIARRVPDDRYVVMPNQQGIDFFDLKDAYGEKREHLCSEDLIDFILDNHLNLVPGGEATREALLEDTLFNARAAFGSHDDADHAYNTPRAWVMARHLSSNMCRWDGPEADYTPESDDIPWSFAPRRKITVEDVKYVLSSHYQGTPYDPYSQRGDPTQRGRYRSIGVNRNNVLVLTQLRPYAPAGSMAVEWVALGSNAFNEMVPFYPNVSAVPAYLTCRHDAVTTDALYWASRLLGALADAHFARCAAPVERYQKAMQNMAHRLLNQFDREAAALEGEALGAFLEGCNRRIADEAKAITDDALAKVLFEASSAMKNAFARGDA